MGTVSFTGKSQKIQGDYSAMTGQHRSDCFGISEGLF